MCVAALAWAIHPRWRLVAIANRDEFHERPAAPLGDWDSGIIAGRDLQAGGTWLGLTAAGRFALVTNFRAPGFPLPGMASRGGLVTGWLEGRDFGDVAAMNPFHLIAADSTHALHLTNHPNAAASDLAPGIHGVSNGAFDQPWPKTRRLTDSLADWLAAGDDDLAVLFAALGDERELPAEPDSEGPDQPFSPVFIRNPVYGTRASTVVLVSHDGTGLIAERSFDADGRLAGEVTIRF
jgi:uncharacterized protein with NRDE domain